MKSIIVPTDFSEDAYNALEFALEMAPKIQATILLLHVVEIPPLVQTLYMDNYGVEQLYSSAKVHVQEKLDSIRLKYPDHSITTLVFQGNIADVIKDIEHQYEAQYIIMGTKGTSGFKETFVGSNTEKVVRNVRTPVISIHNKVDFKSINNIVIPTNGNDTHKGFFSHLQRIQQIFEATISILFINALHAHENEEEIRKRLEEYAKNAGLNSYKIDVIKAITPEDGIENYVEINEVDMVAIATHGRHGLSHLLYGSLAEDLTNHLKVPVSSYNLKLN